LYKGISVSREMITSAFRKRWGRTLNEQWYDLPQQARIPSPAPPPSYSPLKELTLATPKPRPWALREPMARG